MEKSFYFTSPNHHLMITLSILSFLNPFIYLILSRLFSLAIFTGCLSIDGCLVTCIFSIDVCFGICWFETGLYRFDNEKVLGLCYSIARDVFGLVMMVGFALGLVLGAIKLFSINELILAFLIGILDDDLLPYSLINFLRLYKKFSSFKILFPSYKMFSVIMLTSLA